MEYKLVKFEFGKGYILFISKHNEFDYTHGSSRDVICNIIRNSTGREYNIGDKMFTDNMYVLAQSNNYQKLLQAVMLEIL